jgi:rRNA maturation RNase YbeY
MPSVRYFYEDVDFKLSRSSFRNIWIKKVITLENRKLDNLNYIFCSDEYLLEINKEYLNHKTYTDIITFDTSERADTINGDIFISIERVKENSIFLGTPLQEEINRVMIHGILHLVGYKDKSDQEKRAMRKREDAYLSLLNIGFT